MGNESQFSSREARLTCSGSEFYDFITDMRNFGQFLPPSSAGGWHADADSCRFDAVPLGEVRMRIISKTPCASVIFEGNILSANTFRLVVSIADMQDGKSGVRLMMETDLNPVIRMMASGPIERFLETLVCEMEKFDGWKR